MRETDLSPAVGDKEIATYLQHVLTIDISMRATVWSERDSFGEFMGTEGSSRAEHKLVSLYCVLAIFGGHTSVLFVYLLVDGDKIG